MFGKKKVKGVTEVCGYKDDVGIFYDTREAAEYANLKRFLEQAVYDKYYRAPASYYDNGTTPSYKDSIFYILENYDLVEKGTLKSCEECQSQV